MDCILSGHMMLRVKYYDRYDRSKLSIGSFFKFLFLNLKWKLESNLKTITIIHEIKVQYVYYKIRQKWIWLVL